MMISKRMLLTIYLLAWLSAGCVTDDPSLSGQAHPSVTLMTFNVENLFDTIDDAGKDDATYLPITKKQSAAHREGCEKIPVERWRDQCLNYDWNESALEQKMTALARAILQIGNGRGPDVVVLQEVENLSVLEQLRTGYLAGAGYRPAILLEGDDLRGIDVAFLSRLELAGQPTLHSVTHAGFEQSRINDTRGILEATFRLPDGSLLTGFAVHFPAPFHPYPMREQAYVALNRFLADLPAGRMAFAAGDFNTTAPEDAEQDMLGRFVRDKWLVAHEACSACPGTHYYAPRDDWSFLDMILWARPGRGEKATWRMRAGSSVLVNRAPGQTRPDRTPNRFELPAGTGISDHWPLAVTIEMVPKQ
ncbi:MAG: endonuclease/exonuclease/phosphatase family protein [Gammaproteobacteria bacterium]|nr:endonuclease/exonuclease/phosphatase family protein [Gammaproteobacteria bacterium]